MQNTCPQGPACQDAHSGCWQVCVEAGLASGSQILSFNRSSPNWHQTWRCLCPFPQVTKHCNTKQSQSGPLLINVCGVSGDYSSISRNTSVLFPHNVQIHDGRAFSSFFTPPSPSVCCLFRAIPTLSSSLSFFFLPSFLFCLSLLYFLASEPVSSIK